MKLTHKTKFIIYIAMFFLEFASLSYSKTLPSMGSLYPIVEVDFMQYIASRFTEVQQTGQWSQLQTKLQQQALRTRDRPSPVTAVSHAVLTNSVLFDPSITLDHDVMTNEGIIIATAGTRINPLARLPLTKTLIFYDADDIAEVNLVVALDKKLQGRDKLILVRGSLLSQEKLFKKPIYFDQQGILTRHFTIKHVPATIESQGLQLRITEMKV